MPVKPLSVMVPFVHRSHPKPEGRSDLLRVPRVRKRLSRDLSQTLALPSESQCHAGARKGGTLAAAPALAPRMGSCRPVMYSPRQGLGFPACPMGRVNLSLPTQRMLYRVVPQTHQAWPSWCQPRTSTGIWRGRDMVPTPSGVLSLAGRDTDQSRDCVTRTSRGADWVSTGAGGGDM